MASSLTHLVLARVADSGTFSCVRINTKLTEKNFVISSGSYVYAFHVQVWFMDILILCLAPLYTLTPLVMVGQGIEALTHHVN